MHIAIIGSGYVGLICGACFADIGHSVICVDAIAERVTALDRNDLCVYEPGLANLLKKNVKEGRLFFSIDLPAAVACSEIVFIAVGTPPRSGDGHADLSSVNDVASKIATAISKFTVVVVKSTVPVGTCENIEKIIRSARPDADFVVLSNPEFLCQGSGIDDFRHPDRIVIGGNEARAHDILSALYRQICPRETPILSTDRRTAELIKYAANAFLATKISFINEIADLAEKLGANLNEVARGIGLDHRIGSQFLRAGPGFGGSCLPKDAKALIKTAQDNDVAMRVLEAVVAVNERRTIAMARKVAGALNGSVQGKIVAVLGLTFKSNTDDMREAPSINLINALQSAQAIVRAYDPVGMGQAKKVLSNVIYCDDPYGAAKDSDAIVIVTDWKEFRTLDFTKLKQIMANPLIIDLYNLYQRDEVARHGFAYCSVGYARPPS